MLGQLSQHLRCSPTPSTSTPTPHRTCAAARTIEVSATGLDSGNIEAVSLRSAADLRLRIRPDVPCPREEGKGHFHWFYFAARGVRGQRCVFKIVNAGEASYAWKGWPSILEVRACVA